MALLNGTLALGHVLARDGLALGGVLGLRALQAAAPARAGRPGSCGSPASCCSTSCARTSLSRRSCSAAARAAHAPASSTPARATPSGGLAVLACIITATPGTAWAGYDARSSVLTIHVLDLVDDDDCRARDQGPLRAPADGDLRMSARRAVCAARAALPQHRCCVAGDGAVALRCRLLRADRARRTACSRSTRCMSTRCCSILVFGMREASVALLRGRAGDRDARLRFDRGAREVPAARRGDRMSARARFTSRASPRCVSPLLRAARLLALRAGHRLVRPAATATFYERVHPPTMGTTPAPASCSPHRCCSSRRWQSRPVLHEIVIARVRDRDHAGDLHAARARRRAPRPHAA